MKKKIQTSRYLKKQNKTLLIKTKQKTNNPFESLFIKRQKQIKMCKKKHPNWVTIYLYSYIA